MQLAKYLPVLAAFVAIGHADPVVLSTELEPYALKPVQKSVSEWTTEQEVSSGVLYYTQYKDDADNILAYLTIGGTNNVRLLVTDPETLRKVNTIELQSSDYTSVPGTKVTTATFEGKTVYNFFSGEMSLETTTRSVTFSSTKYQPMYLKNAKVITSYSVAGSNYKVVTNELTSIVYGDNSMTASYKFGSDMAPYPSVAYAYLVFDEVRGTEIPISRVTDDLVDSDYYFIDTEGTTTLGTLRRWVKDRYDGVTAYSWSTKPAIQNVSLSNHGMIYDNDSKFWTRYWEYSSTNKVLQWIMNGLVAWEFKMGEFSTDPDNFQVRKIEWENNDQDFCVYFDANYGEEPYIVTCDDLNTLLWFKPDQTIDYNTTYDVDGRTCYKAIVRLDADKTIGFYQARAKLPGLPSAVIRTKVPMVIEDGIYLRDSDGKTWKLGVTTTGALTTEQVDVE